MERQTGCAPAKMGVAEAFGVGCARGGRSWRRHGSNGDSPPFWRPMWSATAALMERDEAGTFERLKRLRKDLIEPVLEQYGGRFVDLKGDGAIVEFGSVVAAVEAAVEIQQAMPARGSRATRERAHPLPDRDQPRRRDHRRRHDLRRRRQRGGAHRAACANRAGCGCRAASTTSQGKLDLALVPSGLHQVKNISEAVETFRVALDGIAPAPPPRLLCDLGPAMDAARRRLLSMLIVTGRCLALLARRAAAQTATRDRGAAV